MKKLALLTMTTLLLGACGQTPDQMSGSRVSVGVAANDSGSVETATKTVTPATEEAPSKTSWTVTTGKGVTFTFMTRPGSDAVYLTGYRILEETVNTANGSTTRKGGEVNKMDLYLTSGYVCPTRSALQSCSYNDPAATPANGAPGQHSIYLEGGLGSLVIATNSDVSQVTNIEFYGQSSTGAPVTVRADGIVSVGDRRGDE